MDKKWCVYIHTNKLNGKKYVGITSRALNERWKKDGKGYREGKFRYAILKYGWDNFEHEVVATGLTEDEANEMEVMLIAKLNTRNDKYGYNIAVGGGSTRGFKHSEETKIKCSLSQKGGKSVRAIKVICDNIVFDCITDCANHYGIPKETLISWLKGKHGAPQSFVDMGLRYYNQDGCTLKAQLIPSDRTVFCDSMEFKSAAECARFYNLNASRMATWLNGRSAMPKRFIDLGLTYSDGKHIKYKEQANPIREVICDGHLYKTINECADAYNVKSIAMGAWLLGRKRMPSKFIQLGLCYADNVKIYEEQIREHSRVICEDNIFATILDCANHYDVPVKSMGSWLGGSRRMPEKFHKMGLKFENDDRTYEVQVGRKKRVVCDNVEFKSLTSCAQFYNINISTMSRWLSGVMEMPEEFKKLGLVYI